jgi:uncharacterized membrane protein
MFNALFLISKQLFYIFGIIAKKKKKNSIHDKMTIFSQEKE